MDQEIIATTLYRYGRAVAELAGYVERYHIPPQSGERYLRDRLDEAAKELASALMAKETTP